MSYQSPGRASPSLCLDQIRTLQREVASLSRPGTSATEVARWFVEREAEMNSLNDKLESFGEDSDAGVILEECKSLRLHLVGLQKKCTQGTHSRSNKAKKAPRPVSDPVDQRVHFDLSASDQSLDLLSRQVQAQDRLIRDQEAQLREKDEKLKETLAKLQQAYQQVYRSRQEDGKTAELEERLRKAEDRTEQQKGEYEHQMAVLQGNLERERQLMQECVGDRGGRDSLELRQLLKERNSLLNQTQERLTKETQTAQELRLRFEVESKRASELDQLVSTFRQKADDLTLKEAQSLHRSELLQQKLVLARQDETMRLLEDSRAELETRKRKKQDLRQSVKGYEGELASAREEIRLLEDNIGKLEGENGTLEDKLRVAVIRISDLEKEK